MQRLGLFLLLLFVVLGAASCKTSPNEGRVAPEVGAVAPEFSLQSVSGDKVTLSAQRGKVTLINFWATWCPPCRAEMPGIQDRYERYQPDLTVLAIDNAEPLDLVLAFQEEYGLTFDMLLDLDASVQRTYQIRGYPTSMFVDENGVIQIVHIGLMTETQLDAYLTQLGVAD